MHVLIEKIDAFDKKMLLLRESLRSSKIGIQNLLMRR